MEINVGKHVINGVNLFKIGHFGENEQIWDILGTKNDVIGPPFRVGRKYFFLKTVSKVILVTFIR